MPEKIEKVERTLDQIPAIPVKITSEQSFRPAEFSQRNNGNSTENLTENGENDMKYLSGEIRVSSVTDAKIQITGGKTITGVLVLTNYRLKLIVSEKLLNSLNSPSLFSFLSVPLGSIDKIEKEKKTKEQKTYEQKLFNARSSANINSNTTILVTCKDMRILRITLPYNNIINGINGSIYNSSNNSVIENTLKCGINNINENDIENFIQTIAEIAFPNDRRLLFAFSHRLNGNPDGGNESGNCNGNSNNNEYSSSSSSGGSSSGNGSGSGTNGNSSGGNGSSSGSGINYPNNSLPLSLPPSYLPSVEPYCILKEFKRLKILDIYSVTEKTERTSLFRVSTVNSNYHLCTTYPPLLMVPRRMSDDDLGMSANFRSGHRLPVLCWGDCETGIVLLLCELYVLYVLYVLFKRS